MLKVKICGMTNPEDAIVALRAGADYLGFILYPPSPRFVSPTDVATIVGVIKSSKDTRHLFASSTPPLLVGVFVNEPPDRVALLLDACGLDLAQLSGNEAANLLTDAGSPLLGRAFKAIRPRSVAEAQAMAIDYATPTIGNHPHFPGLLIDTPHDALYGGTGQIGDWVIAADLARSVPGLMLAGGLNPANVAAAVRRVRPFAVDVAGGVEAEPGRKDHDRVRAFIANAKAA
jgi:phosphoribosylanthranilate isomerase